MYASLVTTMLLRFTLALELIEEWLIGFCFILDWKGRGRNRILRITVQS